MTEVPAELIEELLPGTHIGIGGRKYIRVADMPSYHVEGFVLDVETGHAQHWSRLVRHSELVCVYCAYENYKLSPVHIYEFAGWLTTRPGVMKVGSREDCSYMANAVGEYLKTFPEKFV